MENIEIDKEKFIAWAKGLQEERRLLLELDWTKYPDATFFIMERVAEIDNILDSRFIKIYYYFYSLRRKKPLGFFVG